MAKSSSPSADGSEPRNGDEPEPEHDSLEQATRLRAYEISQSGESGTPEENWERATRELGLEKG
jgi:hypothetical protein